MVRTWVLREGWTNEEGITVAERIRQAVQRLVDEPSAADDDQTLIDALLTIMSDLAVGWLLLDQASIALEKLPETSDTHPDHAFYTGKKFAALFFANNTLATIPSRVQRLMKIDTLPVEMPDEAFATV